MKSTIEHMRDLTPDPQNANKGTERGSEMLKASLQAYGAGRSLLVDKHGVVIAGNKTLEAAASIGLEDMVVVQSDGTKLVVVQRIDLDLASDPRAKALGVADNRVAQIGLDWDAKVLQELLTQGADFGAMFTENEIASLLDQGQKKSAASLVERFGVPPFSVFDSRMGYWQDRKRGWLELGIKSETGRDAPVSGSSMVSGYSSDGKRQTGMMCDTSIFDPVLCEIAVRWFCPPSGVIIDPFAGGSVRGIVSSKLGRKYVGIELRSEQVAANREQAAAICDEPHPVWIEGDSKDLDTLADGVKADLVFTCPPYSDLEVYSDDPRDLSTMKYDDFISSYRLIIAKAVAALHPNRFACIVVANMRDKSGFYRRFVSDTEQAFVDAGARLYNEAMLINSVGSLRLRVGKQFTSSRKLGKSHQNVLVFCKGDGKQATEAIGMVDFGEEIEDAGNK